MGESRGLACVLVLAEVLQSCQGLGVLLGLFGCYLGLALVFDARCPSQVAPMFKKTNDPDPKMTLVTSLSQMY